MWRRWTERIAVGLDGAALAWCQADGTPAGTCLQVKTELEGRRERMLPRRVAAAVVHGRQCGHWMQTAPPGLAAMNELRSLVDARASSLFGDSQAWTTAADFALHRPFLCAAVPLDQAVRLTHWAGACAVRGLHTSLTALLWLCRRQLPRTGWAWLLDDDRAHSVYLADGMIGAVRTLAHGTSAGEEPLVSTAQPQLRAAAAMIGTALADEPLLVDPRLEPGRSGSRDGARVVGLGVQAPEGTGAARWSLGLALALARSEA